MKDTIDSPNIIGSTSTSKTIIITGFILTLVPENQKLVVAMQVVLN